jgi:hypothetical protein
VALGGQRVGDGGGQPAGAPVRAVLRLEALSLLRSRARLGYLALALASAVAVYNGAQASSAIRADLARVQQAAVATREAAARAADAKLAGQPTGLPGWMDPSQPTFVGGGKARPTAVFPVGALGALVEEPPSAARTVRLSLWSRAGWLDPDETPRILRSWAGGFDLACLLSVLLPFAALASAHDLLGRDRELGVLRMLVVGRTTVRSLAAARAAVRLCALLLALLGGSTLGWVAAGEPVGAGLAMVAAIAVGWTASWVALAAWLDSSGRPVSQSAMVGAGLALGAVFVAPGWLVAALDQALPPPDRLASRVQARWATAEANTAADELAARYLRDHPELTVADGSGDWVQTVAALDFVDSRSVPVERQALARDHQRQARAAWWASLWPPAAVRLAVELAAGTDGLRRAAFEEQVLSFGDAWTARHRAALLQGEVYDAETIRALPEFAFTEPQRAERWRLWAFCGLVVTAPGLVLALGTHRRLGRPEAVVGR